MISAASASARFAASSASLLVGLPAAWIAAALWFQAPGGQPLKILSVALWIAFCGVILSGIWNDRMMAALAAFALASCAFLLWWQRIPATDDREWADEVAQKTSGAVVGNLVTLSNVRNFHWRSNEDYDQRWETRSYDLEQLTSADMIMSYWRGPAIAHMLISFGFSDGRHVVFSVEVRRGRRQAYSELGGFFKAFELSIIAADERDVIRVRTNVRGEDDYLYRLRMPLEAMRSLFLGYVDEANHLIVQPRFYNTLTVNCTTLVYHMMKRIVGYLPLDYRLLFSGYLPSYVYKVGGMDQRFSLAELRRRGRITDRARQSGDRDTFSRDIRAGIAPIADEQLPAPR